MNLRLPAIILVAGAVSAVASACGSSDDSVFSPGDAGDEHDLLGGQNNRDGSLDLDALSNDAHLDPDAFWATDPPPLWCGPDGGATPPPAPGGTVDCPDDKNREGCPCDKRGATAACWPGLRKNRNIGICKDGQTTCIGTGEFDQNWGPCTGYVLPDPNVKLGKAACGCFSEGQWNIENLVPYFPTTTVNSVTTTYAMSTYQDPSTGGWTSPKSQYLPSASNGYKPSKPADDWSKDTLKVDCAGNFTLCYELKAGDFNAPKATDCSVVKVCLPATDYVTENVVQQWPNLPGWLGNGTSDCNNAFTNQGGYGEMSVQGKSVRCDAIDDGSGAPLVFNRIQYCKASCNEPDAGADPACATCGQNGSGTFH